MVELGGWLFVLKVEHFLSVFLRQTLIVLVGFFAFTTSAIAAELSSVVLDANTLPTGGGGSFSTVFKGVRYYSVFTPENGSEIWTTDGTSEGTVLFKELSLESGANPSFFGTTTDLLFFSAFTREYGTELWVTDGTAEGTRMVKDIRPGTSSGIAGSGRVVVGSTLYFTANDGQTGLEVWKTDGTEEGTVLITDLWSSTGGGYISGPITSFGGSIFYYGNVGGEGGTLIRSDGTALGTYSLGISPGFTTLRTVIGSYMYMSGGDDINGRELWRSDGTVLGTQLVKDINPGEEDSLPASLVDIDGTNFYFTATDATNGTELWKSDGTEVGTVLVKDINSGTNNSGIIGMTKFGDYVYFGANDGVNGAELWRTDGTEVGTVMFKDIYSGPSSSSPIPRRAEPDLLYIAANDGVTGDELWKTDGTAEGTVLVKDINPGSANSSPGIVGSDGGIFYFGATTASEGTELWKTDGTAEGTVLVKDIPGTNNSFISLDSPSNTKELLFYMSTSSPGLGSELWKSDGTSGGTILIKDINVGVGGSRPSTPARLEIDGVTFFAATEATNGTELWKSDGTSDGTVLIKNIRSGSSSSNPANFMRLGSNLIFTATDGTNGVELWKSDGTSDGTVMIKDIRPGSSDSNPRAFAVATSSLYFVANNGTNGDELWITDGTTGGTYMVRDLYTGSNSGVDLQVLDSTLKNYTTNGNIYLFLGSSAIQSGLWRSDGTSGGTYLVKDFNLSGTDKIAAMATDQNGTSYVFASNNAANYGDYQLWKTDGTVEGTVFLKDLDGGSLVPDQLEVYSYKHLVIGDTRIYFSVEKPSTGFELWTSDGTTDGTYMIKDIRPGSFSGIGWDITNIVTAGDVAYFQGMNEEYGAELWKTDGTVEGTYVLDIFPGPGSSAPSNLLVTNNETELYMSAVSPNVGRELMRLPLTSTVTLSAVGVSGISQTGATVSTSITDSGLSPAHTRGFNYGTSLAYGMSTSTQGRYSLSTHEYTISDLTCNTTYYVQAFAANTYGTTTETTSFTTSACSTSSSSGGGGGGGGTRILTTPVTTPVAASLPPATANAIIFTRDLTLNAQGTDVYALQRFLNARGHTISRTGAGSPGNESSIFGSLTRQALIRFQTSVGITPATGYFGPLTRAFINKLGATPPPPATVQTPPTTITTPTIYTRDLTLGSKGSDVTALQTYLIQKEYLQPGYATGYFGTLTQSALIKFQQVNDIVPALGYFGPKTREVVGR